MHGTVSQIGKSRIAFSILANLKSMHVHQVYNHDEFQRSNVLALANFLQILEYGQKPLLVWVLSCGR